MLLDKDGVTTRANTPDSSGVLGITSAAPSQKGEGSQAPSLVPSVEKHPSQQPSLLPSKSPTLSPTDAPSATPSLAPSRPSVYCVDSPVRMMVDGIARSCEWVATDKSRCALDNVESHCPVTCNVCETNQCTDSEITFALFNGMIKPCEWVARWNTSERCAIIGVEDTCRQTCGRCIGGPTSAPVASPSLAPVSVSNGSCVDSPLRMIVDGRSRSCEWVARRNTENRCRIENVESHCPVTCNACATNQCTDSESRFILGNGDSKKCVWVRRLNSRIRCAIDGVRNTCRQTCDDQCTSSADAPTPSPTPVSGPTNNCVDSPLRMLVDGALRSCAWVARLNTESRCLLENVESHCPVTCNSCVTNQCTDSASTFNLGDGLNKPCEWVARWNTSERCALEGVRDTCRQSCGTCT